MQYTFPFLPCNSYLLDVGCGNGRVTHSIHKVYQKINIIGIDASIEMIDFAKTHYGNAETNFFVDRAEELKTVSPLSMDAITSFACLHWVLKLESAFQRMYDVLNPKGWIGLMFPVDTESEDYLDDALKEVLEDISLKQYFVNQHVELGWNMAKPKDIQVMLQKIGFEIISIGARAIDYHFESVTAFENWILACAQQLRTLPLLLQKNCAQRIARLYLDATVNRQPMDGKCIYRLGVFSTMAFKPQF